MVRGGVLPGKGQYGGWDPQSSRKFSLLGEVHNFILLVANEKESEY